MKELGSGRGHEGDFSVSRSWGASGCGFGELLGGVWRISWHRLLESVRCCHLRIDESIMSAV